MKERITPKDDIEIYNAFSNENTDKTDLLKWALCGKEYEDLEEQGLIVRLPCKVGDKVYVPYNFKNEYGIATIKIEEIKIYDNKNHFMFFIEMESDEEEFNQMFGDWKIDKSIGTSVFLTRAEAEKKLKELKGEK